MIQQQNSRVENMGVSRMEADDTLLNIILNSNTPNNLSFYQKRHLAKPTNQPHKRKAEAPSRTLENKENSAGATDFSKFHFRNTGGLRKSKNAKKVNNRYEVYPNDLNRSKTSTKPEPILNPDASVLISAHKSISILNCSVLEHQKTKPQS